MRLTGGLSREEFLFGVLIASVHGGQHLFLRLLPPILPILVVDLDATLWQLGLLVSVYLFAGGIFQAPMGVLSDRYDRQYLLVPAFFAMGVGYLVFVLAPTVGPDLPGLTLGGHVFDGSYLVMAFGMFVAGVGYSAIHPVGYPLISANVSPEHKGKVLGMWGSASKIGDACAPLLVGLLILVLAWEWILVGVSLFGFAFAACLFVLFRTGGYETRPPASNSSEEGDETSFDWRGTPRQFLFPMAAVLVSFFCMLFAANGIMTYTPVFVADVYGYSASIAGIEFGAESVANFYFSALLLSGALSQLVVGGLTDRFDYRTVLVALLAIAAAGLAVLSTLALSPLVLLGVFVLVGATLFGVNPARDALISEITPAAYEGRTFGYLWTLALVGSSGYPVVIGYLADTAGIRAGFGSLVLGALGGLVCIALLYSSRVYQARPPAPRARRSD